MNILQINKFFSIKGGADAVFFESIYGLREHGDMVAEFSMQAPNNAPSAYSQYFVSCTNLRAATTLAQKWQTVRRFFSSREVNYKLSELIKATHPQVAHLHNVYHELSASAFTTLRAHHVPTVMTVHDFFPLCANHNLLAGGTLAAEALANKPFSCWRYRAVNGSWVQSMVGMLEMYFYRSERIWENIDAFICPSDFTRDLLIKYGFSPHKLHVVPNPIAHKKTKANPAPLGDKIVYVGRLHEEKGIKVLMRALLTMPKYRVLIVGDGPEAAWVDGFIREHHLTNVERRGWVESNKISDVYKEARVVVVPSIFFETGGLSAMEALLAGRIVVGSNRGALPETIQDTITGFLAKPEDPADLARVLDRAMQLPDAQAATMIASGSKLITLRNDPNTYIEAIKKVYQSVIVR